MWWRWRVAAVLCACVAQYVISSMSLEGFELRSVLSSLLDMGPVLEPVALGVAKSEREVNEQQQLSAERLARVADGISDRPSMQPDEVRQVQHVGPGMRCGEKIPPESICTTRGVEIFVQSKYQGSKGGRHSWAYTITFTNRGVDTVQMLSRRWVFTDASGDSHEVKGPGARGVTPVLAPGDEWSYQSGTALATPTGSMHGSFQFDTLVSASGEEPAAFDAGVARLALSENNKGEQPPCPTEADETLLHATSVRATRRVIIGANVKFADKMSDIEKDLYRFVYDVQINNAREQAVTIVGHNWEVATRQGPPTITLGEGVGGQAGGAGSEMSTKRRLPAGEAFRLRGLLTSREPIAIASGHYVVLLGSEGGEAGEGEGQAETFEAEIGPLGLTLHATTGVPDWRGERAEADEGVGS